MKISSIEKHNDSLRTHQIEAKAKIFDAWETYDSVMLQMPTGTGKTYLFTSLINDIIVAYKKEREEINILIVAHRNELLEQISATLSRFGIPHGFIQGSREQTFWHRVQVGSVMSLLTDKNYYNIQRQKFDFIIVDEAHHSLAKTYVDLFNLFPAAKKLGVTATPWRLNHESFLKLYQTIILSPQISWFINNHLLADFDYVSIKPDSEIQRLVNNSEIASTGDFSNEDMDNTFNNQRIRSKLFESYQRFASGKKGIIYAINKKHAANIAELYCRHGVAAVAIDCDTPKDERENLIACFKAGPWHFSSNKLVADSESRTVKKKQSSLTMWDSTTISGSLMRTENGNIILSERMTLNLNHPRNHTLSKTILHITYSTSLNLTRTMSK